MRHVDALSRFPLPAAMIISQYETGLVEKLRSSQKEDEELKAISDKISEGENIDGYHITRGLLMVNLKGEDLIVVPKLMQTSLIRQIHESGHFASARTMQLLKDEYWFPNMQTQVEKVIRNCIVCILAERSQEKRMVFFIRSRKKLH